MHDQAFMPHGYCYLWNSDLIRLTVITDSLIAVAYYSIPVALFLLAVRKKETITFRPLFTLFGLFIFFLRRRSRHRHHVHLETGLLAEGLVERWHSGNLTLDRHRVDTQSSRVRQAPSDGRSSAEGNGNVTGATRETSRRSSRAGRPSGFGA